MSTLTVQNIQGSASSSNTITDASGHNLHAPGHLVQAVQLHTPGNVGTSSSTIVSTTSTSYVDFISKDVFDWAPDSSRIKKTDLIINMYF